MNEESSEKTKFGPRIPIQVIERVGELKGKIFNLYCACLTFADEEYPVTGYCDRPVEYLARLIGVKSQQARKLLHRFKDHDIGIYKNGRIFVRTVDNNGKFNV